MFREEEEGQRVSSDADNRLDLFSILNTLLFGRHGYVPGGQALLPLHCSLYSVSVRFFDNCVSALSVCDIDSFWVV